MRDEGTGKLNRVVEKKKNKARLWEEDLPPTNTFSKKLYTPSRRRGLVVYMWLEMGESPTAGKWGVRFPGF